MAFIIFKLFVTAGFIVMITEIAKRSDKFGGMIAALPLTTLLVIFWMHFEGASNIKIAKHITYTLFSSRPLCQCFFCFPGLLENLAFATVIGSIVLTIFCVYVFNVFSESIGFRIL